MLIPNKGHCQVRGNVSGPQPWPCRFGTKHPLPLLLAVFLKNGQLLRDCLPSAMFGQCIFILCKVYLEREYIINYCAEAFIFATLGGITWEQCIVAMKINNAAGHSIIYKTFLAL